MNTNDIPDPAQASTDNKFREALALHRQAQFAEAAIAYQQVLNRQPQHFQALTFLGVIAFQLGQFERALELANEALEIDPHSAATQLIHAHSLARLGQKEMAVASYDRVIVLKPDLAEAYSQRGDVLQRLGRHLEALSSYDRALELNPALPETHNNRGNSLTSLRRYQAAIDSYDRALAVTPGIAEAHFNRGLALYELKRHEAALASYDRAISINPQYAEAYSSRGTVLKDLKQYTAALASYDRAIAIKGDYAQAFTNRGNLLAALGEFEAALASHDAAISMAPTDTDAHYNRGIVLIDLARHHDALASFDCALAIDGQHAYAHFSRAIVSLLLGDLPNGWRDFEWRWKNEHCASRDRRNFPRPLWLGGDPLDDRIILVHAEQGLGDTIQFCRYAEMLAARGAKVIFETPKPLLSLFGTLRGVTQLVAEGDPLPDFDCYSPLMSLPLAFGTTLETIPSKVPYLFADAHRVRYWRLRLGPPNTLRVGIVWSGGFRPEAPDPWVALHNRRNIPLDALAALNMPGIEFYSLQKGEPAETELASLKAKNWHGPDLLDYATELHDFQETAALMAQLDLVISVDTATAHLAGALGKPVWLLNRFDTCWRWLLNRSDSPWYPTLRVYRQERPGDWQGVVHRVRRDLERLADEMLPRARAASR